MFVVENLQLQLNSTYIYYQNPNPINILLANAKFPIFLRCGGCHSTTAQSSDPSLRSIHWTQLEIRILIYHGYVIAFV